MRGKCQFVLSSQHDQIILNAVAEISGCPERHHFCDLSDGMIREFSRDLVLGDELPSIVRCPPDMPKCMLKPVCLSGERENDLCR